MASISLTLTYLLWGKRANSTKNGANSKQCKRQSNNNHTPRLPLCSCHIPSFYMYIYIHIYVHIYMYISRNLLLYLHVFFCLFVFIFFYYYAGNGCAFLQLLWLASRVLCVYLPAHVSECVVERILVLILSAAHVPYTCRQRCVYATFVLSSSCSCSTYLTV